MVYQVGGLIQATDINHWLNRANTLWGVGSGGSGYGQTTASTPRSAGQIVGAFEWQNIRDIMSRTAAHTGVPATNLVPSSFLDTGDVIHAHVNGSGNNAYNFEQIMTALEAGRFNTTSGSMTLSSNVHQVVRNTTWTSLNTACVVDMTWASEDQARFFFNTGGEIRLRLFGTGTFASSSAPQDADWRDVFINKVGTVTLTATGTARTGSAGVIQFGGNGSLGFYGLSGTVTNIYDGTNIGSGAYAANDVYVAAQVLNVAGVNGGNGNTIRFTITLRDDHANVNYDAVSAGFGLTIDTYRQTNTSFLPISPAAPTITTLQNWIN